MTWIWALEPLAAYQAVEKGFMLGEWGSALLLACTGSRDRVVSGPSHLFQVQHLRQTLPQTAGVLTGTNRTQGATGSGRELSRM